MRAETEKKIGELETFKDYLIFLQENFDCKNCTPSGFIKSTLIWRIMAKVREYNINVSEAIRVKVLNSPDLNKFIEILLNEYSDKLSGLLTKEGKNNLKQSTKEICALTRLQENSISVNTTQPEKKTNEISGTTPKKKWFNR